MRYTKCQVFKKDGSRVFIMVDQDVLDLEREKLESDSTVAAVLFEGDGPSYDWDDQSLCWQGRLF